MFKKLAFGLFAASVALTACAGDAAPPAAPKVAAGVDPATARTVAAALDRLSPGVRIQSIAPAPVAGFYRVIAAGQMVYVSGDGRYMLNGDVIDLPAHRNLTEEAWAAYRKTRLADLPADQAITFAPAHPKYTVKVFTDVNCAYCRMFHKHIAEYNDLGIAVQYLAWPREGLQTTAGNPTPTYREMVSVWCAPDRKAAFTEAKQGDRPKDATCTNPVAQQYHLGEELGVDGTPTVIAPDGAVLGGYVPPEKLLKMLQKHGAG